MWEGLSVRLEEVVQDGVLLLELLGGGVGGRDVKGLGEFLH